MGHLKPVRRSLILKFFAAVAIPATLIFSVIVSGKHFGDWATAVNMESIPGTSNSFNTAFNDGCPIQSPDGLSFYMATNRTGTFGGQDIWVAYREIRDDPWGAPVQLPPPINSSFDDFCPTPVRGHGLFFVSSRPGACGGTNADIYFSRLHKDGWDEPKNLGCSINSPANEFSPSYFEDEAGNEILYFSSNRAGGFEPGGTDSDIYYSVNWGQAQVATGVNTGQDDFRPNVRKDGREIVFDSNRPGGLGMLDIWSSDRESTYDDWATPANLGAAVNSVSNETRASLSWNGEQLVFGSNRTGVEGQADIFVTTREKLTGKP